MQRFQRSQNSSRQNQHIYLAFVGVTYEKPSISLRLVVKARVGRLVWTALRKTPAFSMTIDLHTHLVPELTAEAVRLGDSERRSQ